MKIRTRINPYDPESYVKVTITIPRNEADALSFSEVASEVSRSVADAKEAAGEFWGAAQRQVVPKGYFGEDK